MSGFSLPERWQQQQQDFLALAQTRVVPSPPEMTTASSLSSSATPPARREQFDVLQRQQQQKQQKEILTSLTNRDLKMPGGMPRQSSSQLSSDYAQQQQQQPSLAKRPASSPLSQSPGAKRPNVIIIEESAPEVISLLSDDDDDDDDDDDYDLKLIASRPTRPPVYNRPLSQSQIQQQFLQQQQLLQWQHQHSHHTHSPNLKSEPMPPMGRFSNAGYTGMGPPRNLDDLVVVDNINLANTGLGEYTTNRTNYDMRDIVAGARNGRFGHTEETLKKLPKADQPQRIHTKMLDYQLQGLGWLLQHEHPHLRKNPVHSTQFWHARADGSFYNSMTKQIGAPKLASGGILADDMGLGKTIQMLSLVCADPAAAVKSGLIKADSTPAEFKGKPTLILAPVGLLSNWSDQAAHHIDPDSPLKVLVYYGSSKSRSVKFEDYDVVIGSYGQIRGEYKRLLAIEDPENIRPVNQLPRNMRFIDQPWRRVILDEAHIIRNPNTLVTMGVMRLNAYSRWALTGTPIMNSLTDLFSLVRFLRVSGLMDKRNFESIIKRGFEVKGSDSETRLQALMMEFTLRRLKSMNSLVRLNLPPLTVFTHTIEWTKEERRVYDAMQAEAFGAMMEWHQAARGEGQARLMYLFEALLRLRQICNHQQLCGERLRGIADIEEKEVVEPTHDNIMALQLMLQTSIEANEECPVCFEVLQEPRITLCKHIFCKNCIEETIHMSHKCPYCRHPLTSARDSLIAPMEETGADEVEITEGSSSKLDAIMKILITQKSQNDSMPQEKPIKTVVFSQWTSFLNILEPLLDDAEIKFSRIDGTMKIDERDAAIKQLADDRETTVLLASLAVSSTGLNLTMASQVIMCDLWWNIAQERQAIDRCHRLGQTRPVNVFRLVMKNSIEQRVIKIQEEKEEIVERALNDGKKPVKSREALFTEIQRLLTSSESRVVHEAARLTNPAEERARERERGARVRAAVGRAAVGRMDADLDDFEEEDDDNDSLDGFIVRDGEGEEVGEGEKEKEKGKGPKSTASQPIFKSLLASAKQKQGEVELDSESDGEEEEGFTSSHKDFLLQFARRRKSQLASRTGGEDGGVLGLK